MLEQALTSGLVRVEITLPSELDGPLSEALRSAFRLRQAVVVSGYEDSDDALRQRLAELPPSSSPRPSAGVILGVAIGRTLSAMTSQLARLAPCTVVQLTGALSSVAITESTVETFRRLSAISGGAAYPIHAPLLVSDASAADMLRREPGVAEALRQHAQITTAVVAIGSLDPPNSTIYDERPNPDRQAPRELGIQAECCAVLIDNAA